MNKPTLRIPPPLESRAGAIHAMLEPCVDLHAESTGAQGPADGSRMFGAPLLPHVGDWPRTPEGRPMLFVSQVNLTDAARLSDAAARLLPPTGLLSFFYDIDSLPRGEDVEDRYRFRVLWTPDAARGRLITSPRGAPDIGAVERSLSATPGWRLPSEVDASFTLGTLDENEFNAYADLAASLMPPCENRLLGPADWLESDARAECAAVASKLWGSGGTAPPASASSWRLLWQIGGGQGLDRAVGDEVMIYILIRDEDLAERRFIRSWVAMQTG